MGCHLQLRMGLVIKTESVELFVYLVIGIWRSPSTNKQYPTLVQYEVGTERAVDSYQYKQRVSIAYPCTYKIAKFYNQGLAKHFH